MKTLNNSQLESFNTDYVRQERWAIFEANLLRDFPDGIFNFIDIGGGNGLFADKILDKFPNCFGTVLDNSKFLLDKNQPNSRKKLLLESAENISTMNAKYDLVCFNWVLHHFVGNSYAESRSNIRKTLLAATDILSDKGRVSIFENMYNGFLYHNLPSHIIFNLTASKRMAKLLSKQANTSGVGVCFLSQQCWNSVLTDLKFNIRNYSNDQSWEIPTHWRLLFVDNIRCGHFWLSTSS